MQFFVASKNPVKINAVKFCINLDFPDSTLEGVDVASGVKAQPLSDEETKRGAMNRARNLRELLIANKRLKKDEKALCIGLEGGVFHPSTSSNELELWSTVWVVVLDENDKLYLCNGARFPLPEFISEMLHDGQEMGPGLGKLVGEEDLRQKEGMIGYLTNNFTNRTSEYASVAKLAIGLWYGENFK